MLFCQSRSVERSCRTQPACHIQCPSLLWKIELSPLKSKSQGNMYAHEDPCVDPSELLKGSRLWKEHRTDPVSAASRLPRVVSDTLHGDLQIILRYFPKFLKALKRPVAGQV